jgi:hypothetical protein
LSPPALTYEKNPMTIAVLKPVAQSNAFRLDRPKFNRAEREAHAQFLCDRAKTIGRGLDVLFHGTRNRERILESGFLRSPRTTHAVCFSRSPKVAAHFATLAREDDEGIGAILVFDRSSLKTRYKLECIDDGWTTDGSEFNEFWRADHDEFEECVSGRDVEIAPHLIAMISTPIVSLSHKQRAVNRAMQLRFDQETADLQLRRAMSIISRLHTKTSEKKAEQLELAYPGISRLWRDGAS